MASKKQSGFTIVELMIAISVFSFAIMLVMVGVIQIGRLYQQGVTKTRLNTLSREIQSKISQDYQYSGAISTVGAVTIVIDDDSIEFTTRCIGSTRYLYKIEGILIIDKLTGNMACSQDLNVNAQYPMPSNSKIVRFGFDEVSSGVYRLSTRFVVGDLDQFQENDYMQPCKSEAGREFCAVVSLESIIVRKVNE